jgi:CHASE1-domain containing sensor protein
MHFRKIGGDLLSKLSVLIISAVLLLIALVMLWYESAHVLYVPPDFAYSADILSTDNAYDTVNNRFAGERYTRGKFFVRPIADAPNGMVEVESNFESNALNGRPASAASQTYQVDPRTGKYASDGSASEASYLFAPRHIQKETSFRYRHIAYEAPVRMDYADQETLFGLNAYRYESNFRDAARVELTNPSRAVPEGEGVLYTPRIQLWIEPTTGWLLKYEEDTTLSYFDRATGERLRPYHTFTNVFTEESVRQHVQYARTIKQRISFGQQAAPSIILIAAILTALVILRRRLTISSVPIQLALIITIVMPIIGLIGWSLQALPLITLFTAANGLNPLSAICFIALAVSLFLYCRRLHRLAALLFAWCVTLVSGLVILAALGILAIQPDLLIFRERVLDVNASIPSRMAFLDAGSFMLLGMSLVVMLRKIGWATIRFVTFGAGIVVVLSVVGLIAKLLLIDDIFSSTFVRSISVGSSVLFCISGVTLLLSLRPQHSVRAAVTAIRRDVFWPAVLTLPLIVIGIIAQLQQNVVNQRLEAAFDERTAIVESAIMSNVMAYTNTLIGGRALFAASQAVEREEWHAYVQALDIPATHPGVMQVGFIRASVKDRTAVTYVEPQTPRNLADIGLDMFVDPVRADAMERARDSGLPNVSGMVQVNQDMVSQTQHGFLLYVPVYKNGLPTATTEERRQALEGYVYSLFAAEEFIQGAVEKKADRLALGIYDGLKVRDDTRIYRYNFNADPTMVPRRTKTSTVYVANHPWTIRYEALPSFRLSNAEERSPGLVLAVGITMYALILVAWYAWYVMRASAQDGDDD